MPDTRLILHVKGTESQTSELPKEEVRAAISQGKITHSQLIWSPNENAWKQVREYPELLTPPAEPLILHVKGTEAETRTLPRQQVRSGISQGQITHSQLIWSPTESAWKQVRELPDLLPSQKLAPAPPIAPKPVEAVIPESPTNPVAKAAVAAGAVPQAKAPAALTGTPQPTPKVASATPKVAVAGTATPKVAVAGAAAPKVAVAGNAAPKVKVAVAGTPVPAVAGAAPKVKMAATAPKAKVPMVGAAAQAAAREAATASGRFAGALEVKEDDHFHPMKWLCIIMGIVVAVIVAANVALVGYPLSSKFAKNTPEKISVYAHFGAFMQPNVMVIHIPKSDKITNDNFPEILSALAKSSPKNPVTGNIFTRVAITSKWTAEYSFSGESWKQMADSETGTEAERKEFLMGNIDDAAGQSIMPQLSMVTEDVLKTKREDAWKKFVANFQSK